MKKSIAEVLKFYHNYKIHIFPIIVAISSLVLIIFVLYPQITQLITNQKKEKDLIKKSKFLEAKAQELENYDQSDLERKINYATYAYPTDKEIVSAFGLLQSLAAQTSFSVVSLNLGGNTKNGNIQAYNLKVELLGPSSLIPLLLKDIEDSPRLMRVNNVEASSVGSSQAANISLNISLLYSAAPTSFGSIDSPLPTLSQKDEEVIAKLAQVPIISPQEPTQLGPRGKENPFE